MKGILDNIKVIISKNNKEAFMIQPGIRDWVNIVKYISTIYYIFPTLLIFPR